MISLYIMAIVIRNGIMLREMIHVKNYHYDRSSIVAILLFLVPMSSLECPTCQY